VLLVEGADEAPTFDTEQGDGVDVLRLGAAHDDLLDAIVPLVIRFESPKKKPRVPIVVNACTSGAASRIKPA